MNDNLIEGTGSFWGEYPKEEPGMFKKKPAPIVPRLREWTPEEKVQIENEETQALHNELETDQCDNWSCRVHHDYDCMCGTCESAEVNGFADEHDGHDFCGTCDACIDCDNCTDDCDCGDC